MSLLTTKEEKVLENEIEENELETTDEEKSQEEVKSSTNDDIQDVDLSAIKKKRFRIDGDNNRILEIDTSDIRIIERLENAYFKLKEFSEEAHEVMLDSADEDIENSSIREKLNKIDGNMRKLLDDLFATNVSEVCAPTGTMYDPYGGKLRFEHIIEVIGGLYEANLTKEINLVSKRVQKHTQKYTK